MIIEWRPVPDFPGYEINNLGEVRRDKNTRQTVSTHPGKIIKPSKGYNGSVLVRLFKSQKPYMRNVAKLVLMAFVGPPPFPRSHAIHIDANILNNRVDNLRWSTTLEGSSIGNSKLTSGDVREIREARKRPKPPTLAQLASRYGVTVRQIHRIVHGSVWRDIG